MSFVGIGVPCFQSCRNTLPRSGASSGRQRARHRSLRLQRPQEERAGLLGTGPRASPRPV